MRVKASCAARTPPGHRWRKRVGTRPWGRLCLWSWLWLAASRWELGIKVAGQGGSAHSWRSPPPRLGKPPVPVGALGPFAERLGRPRGAPSTSAWPGVAAIPWPGDCFHRNRRSNPQPRGRQVSKPRTITGTSILKTHRAPIPGARHAEGGGPSWGDVFSWRPARPQFACTWFSTAWPLPRVERRRAGRSSPRGWTPARFRTLSTRRTRSCMERDSTGM